MHNKNLILNELLHYKEEVNNLLDILGSCIDYTFFKLGHSDMANKILIKIGELKARNVLIDKNILEEFPSTISYFERKKK